MTVVVWDGQRMAADRQAATYGNKWPTQKIWRVGDTLVGASGCGFERVLNWVVQEDMKGEQPQVEEKDWGILLVRRGRGVWVLEAGGVWKVEREWHAIGGGRDFACAALYYGKDAVEAVRVTGELSDSCGLGCDWLSWDERGQVL